MAEAIKKSWIFFARIPQYLILRETEEASLGLSLLLFCNFSQISGATC
jgi:hypothetical protein